MRKKNITLYDIKRKNGDWFSLTAYYDRRKDIFYLEGQDFTALAEDMFGDEEYEYYYIFPSESIAKLKKALNNDDILKAVESFFHGEMLNKEFIEFCRKNEIRYEHQVV